MNNLLPSSIRLHEKYDLKGSTYKRKASKQEKSKATPTLKDLDFIDLNADGVILEPDTYSALIKTIDRDCRVCVFTSASLRSRLSVSPHDGGWLGTVASTIKLDNAEHG